MRLSSLLSAALCAVTLFVTTMSLGANGAANAAESSKLWSEKSGDTPSLALVPNFRTLADQVIPAVVSIQVEQRVRVAGRRGIGGGRGGRSDGGGFGGAPPNAVDPFDFFNRYFGGEMPREYMNRGLGTGFVIDGKGLILTNYHVVENADHIEVSFAAKNSDDVRVMTAKVLGSAKEYDVALIATEQPANAPITYLGNSDNVQIGDWVMAVGNPFGLSHSVSVGIISAKERREIAPSGRHGLYNFLQTDASINPGNSGGPLVDLKGQVIGINSAVNASGSGIGFAIPINMVKDILPQLKTKGKFTRSWMGIKIQPLTPELAQSFGLKKMTGALIAEVVDKGPADEAGVQSGDIVTEFDGKLIHDSSDLPLYASMAGTTRRMPIKVFRDKKELSLTIKLENFPDDNADADDNDDDGENGSSENNPEERDLRKNAPDNKARTQSEQYGMTVSDLTPNLAQRLQLARGVHGVVVKEVLPGGLAERAGFEPGDVILSIQDTKPPTARSFVDLLKKYPKGSNMLLKILRQGTPLFVAMRKP